MALRVLHLSTYAGGGGAGRAAAALNEALQKAGVDSRLVSAHGTRFKTARAADRALWRLQRSSTETWRSPARFGSLSASEINASSADVVNLHWVTDGFLSIEEIGKINKPLVMSMYDMWPFCGSEHYGVDEVDARWRTGYTQANRPVGETGWDIDRNTWERKERHWSRFHLVPASSWLTAATEASRLMGEWPVTQIPHAIDPHVFYPIDKAVAREALGLEANRPTVGFIASAGVGDKRKGFDLLAEAMRKVRLEFPRVQILIVGPSPHPDELPRGLKFAPIGPVHGDKTLAAAYSAADVLAVPSRQDNMPLTAMEAHMCARPVVAYNTGGLSDIIDHETTGYLAVPYLNDDLARGLVFALYDSLESGQLGQTARQRAIDLWGFASIHDRYLAAYKDVCAI